MHLAPLDMRRGALVLLLALATATVFPARAHAQPQWAQGNDDLLGAAAFASLVSDLSFSTYAMHGIRLGPWMSGVEIALSSIQFGMALWLGIGNPLDLDWWARGTLIGLSAWPAALTVHGVWSLTSPPAEPPPTQRAAPRMRLVPTVLSDGLQFGGGLSLSGSFW